MSVEKIWTEKLLSWWQSLILTSHRPWAVKEVPIHLTICVWTGLLWKSTGSGLAIFCKLILPLNLHGRYNQHKRSHIDCEFPLSSVFRETYKLFFNLIVLRKVLPVFYIIFLVKDSDALSECVLLNKCVSITIIKK